MTVIPRLGDIEWHWVQLDDPGYRGELYLIGLCTGTSSWVSCGTGLGIVTWLFSTSDNICLSRAWIFWKHIDLFLLPSLHREATWNAWLLPPSWTFCSIGSQEARHRQMSLCLLLISVWQRAWENVRAVWHQVLLTQLPRRIATACYWVILLMCATEWGSTGSSKEQPWL